jgi:hypothetical protein
MNNSDIDRATAGILEKHWDGHVPVDPVRIAKSMGVEVRLHPFEDDTIVNTGLIQGKPVIILDSKTLEAGGPRARFSVAHALGHIALHHNQLKEIEDVGEVMPGFLPRRAPAPR